MPLNVSVCQVRVRVGKPIRYSGGHIYPSAGEIGSSYPVSKNTAKTLAASRAVRVPRMGWEVELCDKTYLSNMSGSFYVELRKSGGLQGARRRRKARR